MSLAGALKFLSDNQGVLLAAAYALLNLANALLKGPAAQGAIAKLADFLSLLTRKDAAGTLKLPCTMSGDAPKSPPSLKALILLPIAFLASLPGCAFCKDATNAAEPRCVLESNMVKCGETAGFALVPVVLALIAGAIAGQPFDAGALEAQLMSQGVKDVPCVLAALEDYLAGSALAKGGDPASLMLASQMHEALLAALAKRGIHGRVSLKLRGGHSVEALVP